MQTQPLSLLSPLKVHPLKTYLITGGAGFIGSHLATMLLAQGDQVAVIDDLSTGSLENIRHLLDHPQFHFARASVTNETVLDRLASQADTIIHLAAAVGVQLIVNRPVHTLETNIMGTEAVLRAAVRYNAKVLIASTSEVYGKSDRIPFREEADLVLGPTHLNRWAYAATKMVDEFLALAYYQERGLPVVICRLFNTVGPRQSGQYGMVVPRFVQQALAGEALTVYGDGNQSRCFLHVQDVVTAIGRLIRCPEAVGQAFNIGSQEEISILDLARQVLATVNPGVSGGVGSNWDDRIHLIPYDQAYAPGFEDMRRRVPDIAKIKEYVGWEPQLSLHQILQDVVESYRAKQRELSSV